MIDDPTFVCSYCERTMPVILNGKSQRVVEHMIPKRRGGPLAGINTVIACYGCNVSKGNLTPQEWRSTGRKIPQWIVDQADAVVRSMSRPVTPIDRVYRRGTQATSGVGCTLRLARERAGVSQRALATMVARVTGEETATVQVAISRYENAVQVPPVHRVVAIMRALGSDDETCAAASLEALFEPVIDAWIQAYGAERVSAAMIRWGEEQLATLGTRP